MTLCCIAVACIQTQAQQKPHYTQYILNQYILNPALTGIENYTDIKVIAPQLLLLMYRAKIHVVSGIGKNIQVQSRIMALACR